MSSRAARGLVRLVVALVIAAAGALTIQSDFGRSIELRAYDSALRFVPDPAKNDGIVIVGIDDQAVDMVGSWPWSRSVIGDGLILMKSLGAETIVLDIEYDDPSPIVVDERRFQDDLRSVFGELGGDLGQLAGALESGQIAADGASRVLSELSERLVSPNGPRGRLQRTLLDRDTYLGAAISATDSTIVAASFNDRGEPGTFTLPATVPELTVTGLPTAATAINGPIPEIVGGAVGVGFVNLQVDPDGVTRRTPLVVATEDGYLPALGLVPLVLDGYREVELTDRHYELRGGGPTVRVPRTEDGTVLLRWHRGQIQKGFTTVSYANLIEMERLLADIVFNLELMGQAGYLSVLPGGPTLFESYNRAQELRSEMIATGNSRLLAQYTPRIETFISDIGGVISEESESRLFAVLDDQPAGEDRERIRDQITEIFAATRELTQRYTDNRARVAGALEDATVLVGFTAASTTDLGVTPFEEEYLNVGMHATLLRTLRSGSFLDELPPFVGLLVFLLAIVILILVVELLSPRIATFVGLAIVVFQITGSWIAIRTTGIYVPVATSSILTFVAFALVTAITYVMSERDKRDIRLAFEHYLSPSVISSLLEDPERLNVGGEQRRLTAMFTDVAGFSTAVDRLEPQAVVTLLGEYLSEMTAPILDTNGTIDKYEGDAIVSFFGAPLDDPYHARHACRAALAMRRLEPVLNDRLIRAEMTPLPLRTRVGIHTGTMTVGNLGTPERLDYTIIGPEVNLAARLENVNKQYGTWTIISEETHREAGEGFLVRQMDRVRVVGIDRPVRLFELLSATNESSAAQREALEIFGEGLALFEEREWERARSLFETVLRIFPTDGPARLFLDRCERFARDGVRESWDGVISLTEK